MTSLSYGTWIPGPESENGKPKKRTPTYDKPPKQSPSNEFNNQLLDVNDLELNLKQTSTQLNDYTDNTEKKQSEIHDLLDQMNRENFDNENRLNTIQPIAPPQIIQKEKFAKNSVMPMSGIPDGEDISNYQTIYNQGTTYRPENAVAPRGSFPFSAPIDSNRILLEKLNYMIYLLEQQQNEKTDHILEEFLLYCFLGIFMIYIVDAFARSGGGGGGSMTKYTR